MACARMPCRGSTPFETRPGIKMSSSSSSRTERDVEGDELLEPREEGAVGTHPAVHLTGAADRPELEVLAMALRADRPRRPGPVSAVEAMLDLESSVRQCRPVGRRVSVGDGDGGVGHRAPARTSARRVGADVAQLAGDQGDVVAIDLAHAGLAAYLLDGLVDMVESVQVALREEAAVGVDGQRSTLAVEGPVLEHVGHPAVFREAVALDLGQQRVGEAVVELGEVDIGGTEAGRRVEPLSDGLGGRHRRGRSPRCCRG